MLMRLNDNYKIYCRAFDCGNQMKNRFFVFLLYGYLIVWNVDINTFGDVPFLGWVYITAGRWSFVVLAIVAALMAPAIAKNNKNSPYLWISFALTFPSVIFSRELSYSFIEWVRYASIFCIFWAFCRVENIEVDAYLIIKKITNFICFGSLIKIIFFEDVFYEIVKFDFDADMRVRSSGITNHVNNLGFFGCLKVLVSMFGEENRCKEIKINLYKKLIGVAIGGMIVLASGSRTSIILSAFFIALPVFVRCFPWVINNFRFAHLPSRVVFIWISLVLLISLPLMQMFSSGFQNVELTDVDSYSASNHARHLLWMNSAIIFSENPIMGQGFALQVEEDYNYLMKEFNIAQYSHNSLLNAMQSSGVFGIVALLLLVFKVCSLICESFVLFSKLNQKIHSGLDLVANYGLNRMFLFSMILVGTIGASAVEGALQGNYGINSIFALAMAALHRIKLVYEEMYAQDLN